jgi:hypothetical protein
VFRHEHLSLQLEELDGRDGHRQLDRHRGGVVTLHWAIGCDQGWEKHAELFGLSYKSASYRHGTRRARFVDGTYG